jgi:hypothetical protein
VCRRAAPPQPANDADEDPFDRDAFDHDALAAGSPTDGWCAEQYFDQVVKRQLLPLVGWHRLEGPADLQTSEAWEAVVSALLFHALNRHCECCRQLPKRMRIGAR